MTGSDDVLDTVPLEQNLTPQALSVSFCSFIKESNTICLGYNIGLVRFYQLDKVIEMRGAKYVALQHTFNTV